IAARVLSNWGERLRGRSLFVIDDEELRLGWRVLLGAALASSRPHVMLFVGAEEVASVEGVALDPLPAAVLASAVCPAATDRALERAQQIAVRAGGWPGRFARLLWGIGKPEHRQEVSRRAGLVEPAPSPLKARQNRGLRASEQSAV